MCTASNLSAGLSFSRMHLRCNHTRRVRLTCRWSRAVALLVQKDNSSAGKEAAFTALAVLAPAVRPHLGQHCWELVRILTAALDGCGSDPLSNLTHR